MVVLIFYVFFLQKKSLSFAEVYNLIILELKRNYLSQKTKFNLKKQNTKQCISVQKKVYLN